jgi:hypothetical protein
MTGQQEQQTVRGYIVSLPLRKEAGEDSAKVALQDDSGREYHIVPRGMGMDLAGHINARVEVTGSVQQKEDLLLLQVRKYSVDDAFEDDWYNDNS